MLNSVDVCVWGGWLWRPSLAVLSAWHLNVPLISGLSVFTGMGGAAIAPPTSLVEKDKERRYLLQSVTGSWARWPAWPLALSLGPWAGPPAARSHSWKV